eukprot:TRINITY_DN7659_c0_g1_i2.p1 TRINITY_DN7659_c0_g1~~TRINITY_DN7659_c0_g1_i2.p1  ORF type:complete len:396 (+),score=71.46 TRINITY_DN7659_c0_g1_i2:41-1228(+)
MSAARLSRIVLLGTGPSTCVPNIGCLLGLRNNGPCPVCKEAHANVHSKNRRNNPSLLIQYKADEHAETENIIIDCGKTFREQIYRFFPKFGVKSLRGVILTHDHADAVLGLDDLRDVQHYQHVIDPETGAITWQVDKPMQVFCSDQTFNRMATAFPYLTTGVSSPPAPKVKDKLDKLDINESAKQSTDTATATSTNEFTTTNEAVKVNGDVDVQGSQKKEPKRHISQLEWHTVAELDKTTQEEDPSFNVCGLDIKPLRLHHGGSYIALGFLFGKPGSRIAYLSDTNGIPARSMVSLTVDCLATQRRRSAHEILKQEPIDILVLDALFLERKHTSHFSLPDSLEVIRELRPKRTYLTGMTHEFNYHEHNPKFGQMMAKEGLHLAMGYDGLHFDVDL